MKQKDKKNPMQTLWCVIVNDEYYNIVVAKTEQRAKELAKGIGYKKVRFLCETNTYDKEELIFYI